MEKIGAYTERVTEAGEWRPGNPATGQQATPMLADYFNMQQRELLGVLEAAEIDPDVNDDKQLAKSIWAMLRSATANATETLRGVLRVGTQAEVDAGKLDDVAVTPRKLRWGFVLLAASNGYLLFPTWLGSFLIQWGSATAGTGTPSTWPVTSYVVPFTANMFACFSMHTGSGATSTNINFIVDTMASLSQFRVGNSSASNQLGRYIAIGI